MSNFNGIYHYANNNLGEDIDNAPIEIVIRGTNVTLRFQNVNNTAPATISTTMELLPANTDMNLLRLVRDHASKNNRIWRLNISNNRYNRTVLLYFEDNRLSYYDSSIMDSDEILIFDKIGN